MSKTKIHNQSFLQLLAEINKGVRNNIVSVVITAFTTFLLSGIGWIFFTGGTFYNLPSQVIALEQTVNQRSEVIDEILKSQQELNASQKELNLLQNELNTETKEDLQEIKNELREINKFLREQNRN